MNQWISVKENPPKEKGKYIAAWDNRGAPAANGPTAWLEPWTIGTAHFSPDKRHAWTDWGGQGTDFDEYDVETPDFWMPLPEPPK